MLMSSFFDRCVLVMTKASLEATPPVFESDLFEFVFYCGDKNHNRKHLEEERIYFL